MVKTPVLQGIQIRMGIGDLFGFRKDGSKDELSHEEAIAAISQEITLSDRYKLDSRGRDDKDKDHSDCEDCSGSDKETIEDGEAVFSKLSIDYDTSLYNSSKSPKIHFIVPTSQKDWQFDACLEKEHSVQYNVFQWCKAHTEEFEKKHIGEGQGQTLTCSVTSLPIDIMNVEVMRGAKNNVLVLPYFLWINDLRAEDVDSTLDKLIPDLLSQDLAQEDILAKYSNVSIAREDAFVFVCSHTTRDKRCGVTAPYMRKVFDKHLQEHGLYRDNSDFRPHGVNVQYINHVGGHKFAGNVQIYLKKSKTLIWLGRVTPKHIPTLVNELILPEEPHLPYPDKVRCVKKYRW